MAGIYVFNGPNMNLLGRREPEKYGKTTLEDIDKLVKEKARLAGARLECRQTNHEGVMIDWIHELGPKDFLIINPGAWTHSSYAIRDAIAGVQVPAVEVHISNIHAREEFRSRSLIAPVCIGQISGLSYSGYLLALEYALTYHKTQVQKEGSK